MTSIAPPTNDQAMDGDGAVLRLCVVSDYDYPGGGVEHFVRELLGYVSERCTCRLVTWSDVCLRPPDFSALEIVEHGDVRAAWSAMEWSDLVMVVTSFNVRLLARLAADFANATGRRLMTVLHTSAHSEPEATASIAQERWLEELISSSQVVVAVSDAVVEAVAPLIERAAGTPTVELIENAARLIDVQPPPRGSRCVSFIGRPFAQKGFDLFVRLAADLSDRDLCFRANTASVPLAKAPPNIGVSSLLSDRELLRFFAATDLLVVPYRRADGQPMAVLEALNCGVPVLGLEAPAVSGLLRRHGQMVIEHRYEALRDAVIDWHEGRLAISPPVPGKVSSWPPQLKRYLELVQTAAEVNRA